VNYQEFSLYPAVEALPHLLRHQEALPSRAVAGRPQSQALLDEVHWGCHQQPTVLLVGVEAQKSQPASSAHTTAEWWTGEHQSSNIGVKPQGSEVPCMCFYCQALLLYRGSGLLGCKYCTDAAAADTFLPHFLLLQPDLTPAHLCWPTRWAMIARQCCMICT
jgi:hypothetical protein